MKYYTISWNTINFREILKFTIYISETFSDFSIHEAYFVVSILSLQKASRCILILIERSHDILQLGIKFRPKRWPDHQISVGQSRLLITIKTYSLNLQKSYLSIYSTKLSDSKAKMFLMTKEIFSWNTMNFREILQNCLLYQFSWNTTYFREII